MLRLRHVLFLLLLASVFATGCDRLDTSPTALPSPPATNTAEPLPTVTTAPTDEVAEPEATAETTTPEGTAETPEAATPTLEAEVTGTPTAEPEGEAAALRISNPAEGATLEAGSQVSVSGEAPEGSSEVTVRLTAAGLTLSESRAALSAGGTAWQTSLAAPSNVVGPALIVVSAGDEATATQSVTIERSGATSDPTITLLHPGPDSTAVAGQVLFFTGRTQRPSGGSITISVRYEDCQTVAASQSFDVGEGGSWWGYILVPENVFGPACAVAYFGEFGAEGWGAAQTPLTILEADDPDARGLFVGNFPDSEVPIGEPFAIYGSAFNAPNRQVQVRIDVAGSTVAQGTATIDRFGYWETELTLPEGTSTTTTGQIVASVTYDDGEVMETVPIVPVVQ